MTILAIRGWQDKGKTALAIGVAKELVLWHGYDTTEVICNFALNWPGVHCINNHQMRLYVKAMVSRGLKHKIIIIDEADRVFPARFWHDPEQTETLIGLWQDIKLFNWIIYTSHQGTSVDLLLRSVTQVELEPNYNPLKDTIPFIIYNAIDGVVEDDELLDVSRNIFSDYNRWEVIGLEKPPSGHVVQEGLLQ